jgi:hypothetical protein
LREFCRRAAHKRCKVCGLRLRDTDGHKGGFLKIDLHARGPGECVEQVLGVEELIRGGTQEEEGVVRVLDYGARQVVNKWVPQAFSPRVAGDELL